MSPNLAPKLSKLFSATIFKERKNPLKLAVLEDQRKNLRAFPIMHIT